MVGRDAVVRFPFSTRNPQDAADPRRVMVPKNNVVSIQERRRKAARLRPHGVGADREWAPDGEKPREITATEQVEADRCANEVSVIMRESPELSFEEAFKRASAPTEYLGPEDPPVPMAPKEIREKVFALFAARPVAQKPEARRAPDTPVVDRVEALSEVEAKGLGSLMEGFRIGGQRGRASMLAEISGGEGSAGPRGTMMEVMVPKEDPFRPKILEIVTKATGPLAVRDIVRRFPAEQRPEVLKLIKRLRSSGVLGSVGWSKNARVHLTSAPPSATALAKVSPVGTPKPAPIETGPPASDKSMSDLPEHMRPLAAEAAELEAEAARLTAKAQKLRSFIADYVGLPSG